MVDFKKLKNAKKGKVDLFDVIGATRAAADAIGATAKAGEWADVPKLRGQQWKAEKVGDELTGVLVSKRDASGKFGPQSAYDIQTPEGTRTVYARGELEQRLDVAIAAFGLGCQIRIVFTGTYKIKGLRNPGKNWTIQARLPKPAKG